MARAGGETGRWLYRCDYINLMGTATDQLNQVTGKLNEMGRQGWELVPIVINPTIPGKMYRFRSRSSSVSVLDARVLRTTRLRLHCDSTASCVR